MCIRDSLTKLQQLDLYYRASGLSWVDIGCGTGSFTAQVAKLCSPSHLLGIEPSEAQIEFARKRPMAHQVTFQTGDATALACESSSFDVATMALVLYFLPDPALGVNEMKRVVKPGGIIATYDWDVLGGGLPHEWLHQELRKRGIGYPLPPNAEVSRMDELEKLWDEAGLRSICLLYTSPSPRDRYISRMPSSA